MTKQESKYIYGSIAIAFILILLFLYLISNFSPLYHEAADTESLNQLLQELDSTATESSDLNFYLPESN